MQSFGEYKIILVNRNQDLVYKAHRDQIPLAIRVQIEFSRS